MPEWFDFPLTQPFGPTDEPLDSPYGGYAHFNKGHDYGTPIGTPITALVGGTVVAAGPGSDGWGTRVQVRDEQGNIHNYGHLSGVNVRVGDTVPAGALVGASGNTGKSTGAHISYDVWTPSGEYIDPAPFVGGGGGRAMAAPGQTPPPITADQILEEIRKSRAGGGVTPTTGTTTEQKAPYASLSDSELRQLWRVHQADPNLGITEAQWKAALIAKGETDDTANIKIATQKNVGVSTAASTKGQLTPAEAAAVEATRKVLASQPPRAGYNPEDDIANTRLGAANPANASGATAAPTATAAAAATATNSAAVGPNGRTYAQITGTDYKSQEERDWYWAQQGGKPPAATAKVPTATTAKAPATTAKPAGMIQAEDGSWVPKSFYDKPPPPPAGPFDADRFLTVGSPVTNKPVSGESMYVPSSVPMGKEFEFGTKGHVNVPREGVDAQGKPLPDLIQRGGVSIDPTMLNNRGYVAATLGFDPSQFSDEALKPIFERLGLKVPELLPPGGTTDESSKGISGAAFRTKQAEEEDMRNFYVPGFAEGGSVTAGSNWADDDPRIGMGSASSTAYQGNPWLWELPYPAAGKTQHANLPAYMQGIGTELAISKRLSQLGAPPALVAAGLQGIMSLPPQMRTRILGPMAREYFASMDMYTPTTSNPRSGQYNGNIDLWGDFLENFYGRSGNIQLNPISVGADGVYRQGPEPRAGMASLSSTGDAGGNGPWSGSDAKPTDNWGYTPPAATPAPTPQPPPFDPNALVRLNFDAGRERDISSVQGTPGEMLSPRPTHPTIVSDWALEHGSTGAGDYGNYGVKADPAPLSILPNQTRQIGGDPFDPYEPKQFAYGGQMMADEPIVGMGMQSQQPRFMVGEAGPERLDVTPLTGPNAGNYAGGAAAMQPTMGQQRMATPMQGQPPRPAGGMGNMALLQALSSGINRRIRMTLPSAA